MNAPMSSTKPARASTSPTIAVVINVAFTTFTSAITPRTASATPNPTSQPQPARAVAGSASQPSWSSRPTSVCLFHPPRKNLTLPNRRWRVQPASQSTAASAAESHVRGNSFGHKGGRQAPSHICLSGPSICRLSASAHPEHGAIHVDIGDRLSGAVPPAIGPSKSDHPTISRPTRSTSASAGSRSWACRTCTCTDATA